ncbi:MAG: sigma factor-like helix-turn-helix DNA-binding protein [Clostridium sp.]|uniref:sigma factor-like helix-turn-helix DNA-binding protein n=1 Tax=Clostridium sp. TaxID=1506 RepID=UPI0029033E56|nr:sigma factor-like helix-turn-helix DNA-binding protein [Clostridium sp.]MDU1605018.1 sigma factor-like helix-turn-helix DNA-binding protein [Clostridium sp.]
MGQKKNATPKKTRIDKRRRDRMNEALSYRMGGSSYREIAEAMSISVSTAHTYIDDALKEITRENADQVLTIELVRYDELLNAHYAAALQGDPLATDRVLSIMSRIERLHGVEAPKAEDGASETAAMLNQLLATSIERINKG